MSYIINMSRTANLLDTTNNEDNMSIIVIPTHKISEVSMGDGWKDAFAAAEDFAEYLDANLPGLIAENGDEVECRHDATHDSGMINNACAYVTVDGEESEAMSFRVQVAREQLWERFCNECSEDLMA